MGERRLDAGGRPGDARDAEDILGADRTVSGPFEGTEHHIGLPVIALTNGRRGLRSC